VWWQILHLVGSTVLSHLRHLRNYLQKQNKKQCYFGGKGLSWSIFVCISHLKLIFNLAGVGLRVQSADVVVDGSEFTHWDSRVPTQTRFQNCIMHKHILLLQRERERDQHLQKNNVVQSWKDILRLCL